MRTWERSEKFARFRGVLAVGLSRIRTGDRGFGAKMTPQTAFISVGKLGGSDSPPICLPLAIDGLGLERRNVRVSLTFYT